jgi:glucose/arabinose dehydrogenase
MRIPCLIAVTVLASAPVPTGAAESVWRPASGIALVPFVQGLDQPLHLASVPGDPRLFVVEQAGRIRIIRDGRLVARPFLDIRDRVRSGGEQGLLSVAFHPRFAKNGWLYVDYTDRNGDTRIERYRTGPDPDAADPASAHLVLHIEQPYANHNGGLIAFGPDRMLWIGMGDGGSGGDPHGHAQDRQSLLGKMLRIDVDRGTPYAIPRDNPFVRGGGRPEVWALGLRNPWRWAFDPPARLLYIADVGQDAWEEIDVVPQRAGGLDLGWNRFEGMHPYRGTAADRAGRVLPVAEYSHRDGCSITGGVVYRGAAIPRLRGHYVFADFCSGWIRSIRIDRGRVVERREWLRTGANSIASFGTDAAGELYAVSLAGAVLRVVPAP